MDLVERCGGFLPGEIRWWRCCDEALEFGQIQILGGDVQTTVVDWVMIEDVPMLFWGCLPACLKHQQILDVSSFAVITWKEKEYEKWINKASSSSAMAVLI